jgi:5'-phosphate synthase pdxT subunit
MDTLGLLDCQVHRNAYGRQIASFEASLSWEGRDYPGVFIRAPRIGELGSGCRALISFEGHPVLVRQENILAASFHPELSGDPALHRYFLEI